MSLKCYLVSIDAAANVSLRSSELTVPPACKVLSLNLDNLYLFDLLYNTLVFLSQLWPHSYPLRDTTPFVI